MWYNIIIITTTIIIIIMVYCKALQGGIYVARRLNYFAIT